MDKGKRVYALYKGDEFRDIGTAEYLAEIEDTTIDCIKFCATPTYKKRGLKNGARRIVIAIGHENDNLEVSK